jgi:hypothetical protein
MSSKSTHTALDLAAVIDRILQRGIQHPIKTVIGPAVVDDLDRTILVDAGAGPVAAVLPSAIGLAGMRFEIEKIDSTTNGIDVTPILGQTINTGGPLTLQLPYDSVTVVSDGANWWGILGTALTLSRARVVSGFGLNTGVPGAGMLDLLGPGDTRAPFRVIRPGYITGGAIQVDIADASKDYDFEIYLNGLLVATVPLLFGSTGNQDTTFMIPVTLADFIEAKMQKTGGPAGASDFSNIYGVVELTVL